MAALVYDETTAGAGAAPDLSDLSALRDGDLVFLKTDFMSEFFSTAHPHITARYVLVTHNSDYNAPGIHHAKLGDPQLAAWYALNCECEPAHPKLRPMPIGLENKYWKTEAEFEYLKYAALRLKPLAERPTLLYLNLGLHSNPDRATLVERMRTLPWARVVGEKLSFQQYVDNMAASQFVLSPFGSGIDCHRTWEAFALGAIPVVQRSRMSAQLFEGHSVLVVDDLANITQQQLLDFQASLDTRPVGRSRLWAQHWWHELRREMGG